MIVNTTLGSPSDDTYSPLRLGRSVEVHNAVVEALGVFRTIGMFAALIILLGVIGQPLELESRLGWR
jgi:hypothetical protein